jgi:hypothetical protein
MSTRHRFKQTKSLQERLLQEAQELREQARLLPIGPVRDAALKKAWQAEERLTWTIGSAPGACRRQRMTTLATAINLSA